MIFVSLFLVVAPFIDEVRVEHLVSIAVLIVLAILYYPFIYKGYRIPGMGRKGSKQRAAFLTLCCEIFI